MQKLLDTEKTSAKELKSNIECFVHLGVAMQIVHHFLNHLWHLKIKHKTGNGAHFGPSKTTS